MGSPENDQVPRGIDVGSTDTWVKRAIGGRPALVCCQRTIAAVADAISGAGEAIVNGIRSRTLEAGANPLAALGARFLMILAANAGSVRVGGIITLPGGTFPGTASDKEISLGDYTFEESLNSLPWSGPDVNLAVGNIRLNPIELAVGLELASQLQRQVNRRLSPCETCIRQRIWPHKPDAHRYRRRVRSRNP